MTKIIYAIEESFENEHFGFWSDVAAGASFLAVIAAGLSWLVF